MAIYALIHGAGDVGWYWHLVERELRSRGHDTVAPDLPIEDDDATFADHARLVLDAIAAIPDRDELVVVGRAILTFSRDSGDYIVAGTAGGSPTTPAWVSNLRHHPEVTVEAENRTFPATATIVDANERDRLWDQHVARLPWFADYPTQSGRTIPVIRLTPIERN